MLRIVFLAYLASGLGAQTPNPDFKSGDMRANTKSGSHEQPAPSMGSGRGTPGGKATAVDAGELVLHYSFSRGAASWLAGFADYSLVNGDMHFVAEPRPLPAELGAADGQGMFLQSMNRSDDMFMFLKKGVYLTDGLKPNQRYSISFEITLASNAQDGCFGVGGAPGEGVYLKAGATVDEPVSILGVGQHLELNIDKGHQAQGGADAGIAGTIANGEACDPANERYVRLQKTYEHGQPVSTDDRAQLWLMVGTDSAYEGLTGLFYESITVRLKEVE